jgi:threonine synthase
VATLEEDELRHWWTRLSSEEGVFCEPASAAGVAALAKLGAGDARTAVAIVTGHGLKDIETVDQSSSATVDATLDAILGVLE